MFRDFRQFLRQLIPDNKFEHITFKSNDLSKTFFCILDASLLVTGISVLKPGVMAAKGYSFQYDEKTITDIAIDMDIVLEKEKNEWMRKTFCIIFWNNIFWKIWNFKIG